MKAEEILSKLQKYIDEKIETSTGLKIASKITITNIPTSDVCSDIIFTYDGVYQERRSTHNIYLEQKLKDMTDCITYLQQTIQDQEHRIRFLEQQVNGVPPYNSGPFYTSQQII
jgi:hypothetical protein